MRPVHKEEPDVHPAHRLSLPLSALPPVSFYLFALHRVLLTSSFSGGHDLERVVVIITVVVLLVITFNLNGAAATAAAASSSRDAVAGARYRGRTPHALAPRPPAATLAPPAAAAPCAAAITVHVV